MQRVTRATAAATLPVPPASPGTPGYFARPNNVSGVPATVPGYEWYNGMQEAVALAFEDSGITPDAALHDQLRKHIRRVAGGNVRMVTGNTTLTPDDAGLVLVNASGPTTLTLPGVAEASGRPMKFDFVRIDTAAAQVFVARKTTADTVDGTNNVRLVVGQRLSIVGDGDVTWYTLGGIGSRMQVISATTDVTVEQGMFRMRAQGWSGGGGGGGVGSGGGGAAGGAGGWYGEGWFDVVPGQVIPVTIGAGGAAGTGAPTNGGAGGTTSIGTYMSLPGGPGGASASGGGAALPTPSSGAGAGGQLMLPGNPGNGGLAIGGSTIGGSGGGTFMVSLVGGYSIATGNSAASPGGGGGGAGGSTFAAGSAGAPGRAILQFQGR
ncbi:hypothetical protein KPL78_23015 [Roseomonas sp. HJA6]|uniref:Glycine-rich domain-containing protein n=1 Tax=Roseomonas alba TaxID=2846776 RepID=A0ABS7AEL8_9PROT|nr:hypothetical protein [Neoroseomonas alba]MBW6400750.1 hypothetical protein [Neoroseomonas alba]